MCLQEHTCTPVGKLEEKRRRRRERERKRALYMERVLYESERLKSMLSGVAGGVCAQYLVEKKATRLDSLLNCWPARCVARITAGAMLFLQHRSSL